MALFTEFRNRLALKPERRADLMSSLVVCVVTPYIYMGVAVAAGAPPIAGLMSGIIGGIVVGSLSGCPLQVTGPAAGLTVLVFEGVQRYGFRQFGLALAIAGVFQVAFGLCRLGRWIRAVPRPVIEGMLAAIGLSLCAGQLQVLLGNRAKASVPANVAALGQHLHRALLGELQTSHFWTIAIGGLTLATLVFWNRVPHRRLRSVPAVFAAVTVGALLANIAQAEIHYLAMPGSVLDTLRQPSVMHWTLDVEMALIWTGLGFAVVASAESLLCASAVEKLRPGKRVNYDRELVAQGVGNLLCGGLGAMPVAGVVARSSANVASGGHSRWSTVLHGVWLLLLVACLPSLLQVLPSACLAAVLVVGGWKLANPFKLWRQWRTARAEAAICTITVLGVVCTDLLTGVLVGLACEACRVLSKLTRVESKLEHDHSTQESELHLTGSATFLSVPRLAAVLERQRGNERLSINLQRVHFVDNACRHLIANWVREQNAVGIRAQIKHHSFDDLLGQAP